MEIHFTEVAEREILFRLDSTTCTLFLVFDSEGCGCSVSGVPTLWAISNPIPNTIRLVKASSNIFETFYKPQQEIFFDNMMVIDYTYENRCFRLSSDGQTFNNRMQLIDKRSERTITDELTP